MPQIEIVAIECTTVDGIGLSYAIPEWAPDIAAIGNSTQEPYNMRASTNADTGMEGQVRTKFTRAGPRSFTMSGGRNAKSEVWTVRLHYIGVNELVRT